jgi:hypothetical protein
MCKFYDEYDVVQCIKLGRLTWAGHVLRIEEGDPARKSFVLNRGKWRGKPNLG